MRKSWKAIAQAFKAKMVTVLITSFLLLAAISYAIYCWQRTSSKENAARALSQPPVARGLFNDQDAIGETSRLIEAETRERAAAERRTALLERAGQGERTALHEALADKDLYEEVMGALLERAGDYKKLFALVSFIKRDDRLRVTARLAERFLDAWQASPESRTTAIALHLAATADDASVYRRAIEAVFALWRDGRLPNLSAEELRTLFDGEYWVLSSDSRNSGAGFVLKQRLAKLRLELLKAASKPL